MCPLNGSQAHYLVREKDEVSSHSPGRGGLRQTADARSPPKLAKASASCPWPVPTRISLGTKKWRLKKPPQRGSGLGASYRLLLLQKLLDYPRNLPCLIYPEHPGGESHSTTSCLSRAPASRGIRTRVLPQESRLSHQLSAIFPVPVLSVPDPSPPSSWPWPCITLPAP